jgi:hypothetical protein
MKGVEEAAGQITPTGWRTLGRLRKYPDRPTVLNRQHARPLLRLEVLREVDAETGACVMTTLGQWVWMRHGPVDDRRHL